MTVEFAGDGGLCIAAFPESMNLASLGLGRMVVFLRHGSLRFVATETVAAAWPHCHRQVGQPISQEAPINRAADRSDRSGEAAPVVAPRSGAGVINEGHHLQSLFLCRGRVDGIGKDPIHPAPLTWWAQLTQGPSTHILWILSWLSEIWRRLR